MTHVLIFASRFTRRLTRTDRSSTVGLASVLGLDHEGDLVEAPADLAVAHGHDDLTVDPLKCLVEARHGPSTCGSARSAPVEMDQAAATTTFSSSKKPRTGFDKSGREGKNSDRQETCSAAEDMPWA